MQDNEIFDLSLDIGREIIKSGGEISRAKDTIIRINNAYGKSCEVFALPSIIIAQSGKNIQIRHIDNETTDLSELSRLNNLSRRLCFETNEEIHITKKALYSKAQDIIAVAAATSTFCIFFGGSIPDSICSALIGVIISNIGLHKMNFPLFTSNLINAFISGILAYIPLIAGLNIHPDKIIIGTVMLLVPGLTVVSAIRDLMNGNLIAGIFELFDSIMSALAIAFGIAGAVWVIAWI